MENASRKVADAELANRFGYHPGTDETIPKHELLRSGTLAYAQFLRDVVPAGRPLSSALTKLQEVFMWANFGIAETAPLEDKSTSAEDLRTEIANEARVLGIPVTDETVPPITD